MFREAIDKVLRRLQPGGLLDILSKVSRESPKHRVLAVLAA